MSLDRIMTEQRRLMILKLLAKPGSLNSSILTNALRQIGSPCDHDTVLNTLGWLASERLIVLEPIDGMRSMLARLTADGQEVQAGRMIRAGVSLPGEV
jgi:Fe2+ or Zn2+ uptake regulation protein